MAFDPIYGINDPLLLALLQGIMKTQNTSQVPQSLVQGAVPQQQFDPTLGLSTSAQYINSSPLDQSLSRGANIQALDTKVGLQTNPEEVYAAAVRNDRPDLAAQAQAAMEWQALQERNNALLQKQQIESAGKVQEEQVKGSAAQDNKMLEYEMEKLRQAGATARTTDERYAKLTQAWLDGRSKIANNENIAVQDKDKLLADYDNAYRSQLQNTAASQTTKGELGSDQHINDMKAMLAQYLPPEKPKVGGSDFKAPPEASVVPPENKKKAAEALAINIVTTMKFKEKKSADQIIAEANANPNIPLEIKKLIEFYAKQYK